jgi:penicillin-binding protein 2
MTRIRIVKFFLIFIFLVLCLGLFNLSIIQGKKYSELSDRNCIRLLSQNGSRGNIIDREGSVIVENRLSYDVMMIPQEGSGFDKVSMDMSRILEVSLTELKGALKNDYIAPSIPINIAKNIDLKKAIALEELKMDIPGIIIRANPQRSYPNGRIASHVVGYVNEIDRWRLTKLADYGYNTKDIVGFGGVEEKYDYYLRQEEGGLSFEVDHRGRFIRALGFKPPQNGQDIQLTINLKIQKIVEENLKDRKGCAMLIDPNTGEIIAMVSAPNFNPQVFVNRSGSAINSLFQDSDAPLINRAISAAYPAGSIFKVIVATAGLETKKINLGTTFVCQGSIFIGKHEFNCWNKHGQENLINAIAHSCNVFFYRVGLIVGAQNIHDYALKLGLSRATGCELPYESCGFVPSPLLRKIYKFRNWFDGDTANLAIGQGDVLVTPLQIARMMAVFANKGYLVTPYIVKAIGGRDVSLYHKKIANLSLKTDTINTIRQGLRGVVMDARGTGNVLSTLPLPVAGKTGTAQAPPGQPHAWFVGFFPFKNPKFVICVFLEHGGPGYYATVIAKQIIERMFEEGLI